MVVNLCLPHFNTTVTSNKLCADGYDVTNLVSADPVLRRRGFKLEYFLRPPVQVTLKFGFQVELWRVDVELWPWGMDHGQSCKRLEISTNSDPLPPSNSGQGQGQQKEQNQVQVQSQNNQKRDKQQGTKSHQCHGHQWRPQAQKWGEEVLSRTQQRLCHSATQCSCSEPEFRLVGRCELKEETQVSFSRSPFSPRSPFLSPPAPRPVNCRQEDLWSRGLLSLGSVTQLRVTIPFGGAASALGLKALSVWGQPARCCPPEEVEKIKKVHEASKRPLPRPAPSVSQTKQPPQEAAPPSNLSVPEEFLDPITQEVMVLPMLLPSGVSVDNSTLEEYQKREATWGRPQNDPFTGVPFTSTSQPLPNPQLKRRIDHFVLQRGYVRKEGMLGRRGEGQHPQPSTLVAAIGGESKTCPCPSKDNADTSNMYSTTPRGDTGSGHSSAGINDTSDSQSTTIDCKLELHRGKKRDLLEGSAAEKQLKPPTKRPRNDQASVPSCSSHEQRLSASLDEALFSVLRGRPSFTSNLSVQRQDTSLQGPLNSSQQCQTSTPAGGRRCSSCCGGVSVYSTPAAPVYRLVCGHLLCRACLQRESRPLNSTTAGKSSQICCHTCQSPTSRCDIIRVHH
ncbi:RING finger protein 37 [Aulostomus maculatus]